MISHAFQQICEAIIQGHQNPHTAETAKPGYKQLAKPVWLLAFSCQGSSTEVRSAAVSIIRKAPAMLNEGAWGMECNLRCDGQAVGAKTVDAISRIKSLCAVARRQGPGQSSHVHPCSVPQKPHESCNLFSVAAAVGNLQALRVLVDAAHIKPLSAVTAAGTHFSCQNDTACTSLVKEIIRLVK